MDNMSTGLAILLRSHLAVIGSSKPSALAPFIEKLIVDHIPIRRSGMLIAIQRDLREPD
jgi:hypothetical protein